MPTVNCPRRMGFGSMRRQRGVSLVETMVGVALGLFIVAGASMLATTQLSENRRLILETQVQQDLRATTDIITREIRRNGYNNTAHFLQWSPDDPARQPSPNLRRLTLGQSGDVVSYRYDRPGQALVEFGFRLEDGVIRHRLGATTQDLTDRNTLLVTAFDVQREVVETKQLACPKLCADGTQDCWPTYAVVDLEVSITGRAVSDASVTRTINSRVRLRNDALQFNVSATQACP